MTHIKHLLKSVLILCILSLFLNQVLAQVKGFPKYHFETPKNIPTQRAVSTITQDKEGFIWMGTNGLGLYKYNGIDYQSYQFNEADSSSLSNSLIHINYVDTKNRLWIGTETGIDLYNREKDDFLHIKLTDQQNGAGVSVQTILEHSNGYILAGTHEYGMFKINQENLSVAEIEFKQVPEIRNFLINNITEFDGRILIGTNGGLFELDEENSTASPLEFATYQGREKIPSHIKTMQLDSKGTIWIGTVNNGLFKVDGNENGRYVIEHYPLSNKRILSILETPRNTILCGTENDGLFEIDREGYVINHYLNNKFDANGLKSNSIWSLFLDNQERIWMGYYNNGVGVYDKLYDRFSDIESKTNESNSLQSSSVTGILKDNKGRLWIGMDGGGIDVYDPQTNSFTHLLNQTNEIANGLNSPDVQTLFKDSKQNIWVGTWDAGIYFLKNGSESFVNYSIESTNGEMETNRILSFSEDSKGIIWLGTFSRGIHSFDPTTGKFTAYEQEAFIDKRISFSDVRRVYVDSEDHIWIGSNEGLFKLSVSSDNFKLEAMSSRFYNNEDRPFTSLVLDLYEDSSKNLWIGTDGAGLCKYNMRTDSFEWIDEEYGFSKVTVSSIMEDDSGTIWAGGNNGLTKIGKKKDLTKNFTTNDGLLSNDFNNNATFKDENGTLYFGTYGGVNYFNPKQLPINQTTPPVYLTDLRIFNQPVKPGDTDSPLDKVISRTEKVVLTHDQSVFTIDYASIDFTRPENIHFAYYLDGFETQWNYVKNARNATYTNLPAGTYTFKVKAANSDGIWNEEHTELAIQILPPWWLTNLAIIIYIILTLLISYFIIQFVNARVKTKRAIEQERIRHLQEEALNDKKIQFFTNISHEFRTPLTLIMSPLNDILKESVVPEFLNGKLKIIHRNTMRLNRLIDELLDFRKLQFNTIPLNISAFNIQDFLSEIIEYFEEEAHQRNIQLIFKVEDNLSNIYADRDKLEKIIFNILSNAFKSTSSHGIITVEISLRQQHVFRLKDTFTPIAALELSVKDTGKGIPQEELSKIFDRFYQIKERNEQYYSGTGIGLEVVRSFVDLHKGDIEVESEVGVGTTFRIVLPLGKEHYDTADISLWSNEPLKTPNDEEFVKTPMNEVVKNSQKTLLVIEDNIELRNYIVQELTSEYKVVAAEDGQEGLEKAAKYMPDAIITDVIMPKMNGIEFCAQLKEDLKTSHIPVLMLTAKAMAEDWVEGLEAGADVYLNKPFDMKIMKSHLKQLISNRELLFNKYMGGLSNQENDPGSSSLDQQFILNVIKYIKENIKETNLNVEKLADDFNLSRSQLYRKIKVLTGLSANELIRKIRLERAKDLITSNGSNSISEISYLVGFSSPSYFSKSFKDYFGVLPNEMKEK